MSLFKNIFAAAAKTQDEDLRWLDHFQTLLAFQQYAMELVNDSFARLGDGNVPSDEVWQRAEVELFEPYQVKAHVIPALGSKREVLSLMESRHKDSGKPSGTLSHAYDACSNFITVMRKRADLQLAGFNAWVDDPTVAMDVTSLDKTETDATDKFLLALNIAIQEIGIDGDQFLAINRRAFNRVREHLELPPLSVEEFEERYFMGMTGQRVRFFG